MSIYGNKAGKGEGDGSRIEGYVSIYGNKAGKGEGDGSRIEGYMSIYGNKAGKGGRVAGGCVVFSQRPLLALSTFRSFIHW